MITMWALECGWDMLEAAESFQFYFGKFLAFVPKPQKHALHVENQAYSVGLIPTFLK